MGFQLSLLCFVKKPLFPIFDLYAVRKKSGERDVAGRQLVRLDEDYPELRIPDGELGVYIADAGYDGGDHHELLRRHRLEGVIPVMTDPLRPLKGGPRILSHGVTLSYRGDYTPLCAQGQLAVLPSEFGKHPAQVLRCPKSRPGECENRCGLEVTYNGRGHVQYPNVKLRIGSLTNGEDIRQRPLFPRRGAQFAELFRLRSAVERVFSLLRSTFRYGCEGEARLPIRGIDNMRLRLVVTAVVIASLAMLDDGYELDASVAQGWGTGEHGLHFLEAA